MPAGRKFGGRKKGTPNKNTAQIRARIDEALQNNRVTPLECLLDVTNGATNYTPMQIDAAKAAAPYVHARKVDHGEDRPANNTTIILGGITDADRIAAIQQLIGKAQKKT